jgi:hypothetical protein
MRDSVYNGIELVGKKMGRIFSITSGMTDEAKNRAREANHEVTESAEMAARSAESVAHSLSTEAAKASAKV